MGDGGPGDGPADAAPDAPPQCSTDSMCTAGAPICNRGTQTCRGCVADSECQAITGGPCTEYDGRCIASADALYVTPTGNDNGTCTATVPCSSVNVALGYLTATRRTVVVDDGTYPPSIGNSKIHVSDDGLGRVVISGLRLDYASGAVFSAMTNGVTNPPVVQTDSGTDVVLEGFGVSGGGQDGIRASGALIASHLNVENNNNYGIDSQAQMGIATHLWSTRVAGNSNVGIIGQNGPFEILRCTVIGNGQGGAQYKSGAFTAISSIFSGNGTNMGQHGGISLTNLNGNAPVIQFVTVAYNNTKNGNSTSGIYADNTAGVAIEDSIVFNNTVQNTATAPQICLTCTATHTLFSGVAPSGTGNITGAPGFVDTTTNDFHITMQSAARGSADQNANVGYDVDGEARPQGAFDMGADEIP
jgi:hypothetical protein